MKKILQLALLLVCVFAGTVTAFANPNGGVPRPYTFPAGMTAAETLQYYHHKITDRDTGLAYDVLTEDYKNYFGGYEKFANGYRTTLFSRPSNIHVIAEAENAVKLGYELRAQDWENESEIVVQTFACTAMMKDVNGCWLLDSGSGKLVKREVLHFQDAAKAVLQGYHECITQKEMKAAWNLLGEDYKKSFGSFPNFCKGFETTMSSVITDATPVADGPWMTALEYTLTAKDVTPETNVVQTFKGMAELAVVQGKGIVIQSASNKLVDTYFPPKW
ncbi:MAG: hypothetical protein IJ657_02255 [Acidaminococcaceae bacterium]|nr:hypothetical protein [Acidaminococcaceae bacterium]